MWLLTIEPSTKDSQRKRKYKATMGLLLSLHFSLNLAIIFIMMNHF